MPWTGPDIISSFRTPITAMSTARVAPAMAPTIPGSSIPGTPTTSVTPHGATSPASNAALANAAASAAALR